MSGLINWEMLAELQSSPAMSKPAMWDAFAARYDGYTKLQAHHTEAQIALMGLSVDDSLLDVGAGPGRISIPAARYARSVTALDTSRGMLDALERNAIAADVNNISTVHLGWEDVVPGQNLQTHDVVIASRSPAMRDLVKLDALARKAVYVMLFCGPSLKAFHDQLVNGIESWPSGGPSHSPIAGHALVFNRLVDMGIEAQVTYIDDGFLKNYKSLEEAVADFGWLALPAGSEARFRENLLPFIQRKGEHFQLSMQTRAAVVWWNKKQTA